MSIDDEILALLKEHGAVLERTSGAHNVWKFPDGRIFVQAKTPSDVRGNRNSLADLRRLLGVRREINKNPERKEKTPPSEPLYQVDEAIDLPDWKKQLRNLKVGEDNPMLQIQFKCDVCNHQKGEGNRWLIYRKSTAQVFEVRPWDCRLAKRKDYGHLCSTMCAIKKMEELVRGQQPSHQPVAEPIAQASWTGAEHLQ